MARAAVKAKQQAKAKAQPAKARARGRRRHAGGGNPNQQLFFVRLRRGQRWVYLLLAIVFAVTFAGVGIGSGGGGLSQLYTGLFGSGSGNAVSKAQDEIRKDPAKGYRDLATAYETNGQNLQAITALQSYLGIKKKDANAWSELANLEQAEGNNQFQAYSNAQQVAQQADPSAPFQPGGTLATAVGTNSAYSGAAQRASTAASQIYQQATTAFAAAVTDYQKASKLQPHNPAPLEGVASAAASAGNAPVAVKALKTYLRRFPNAPNRAQVKAELKQLSAGQPTVSSGNG
jgi:tetratricopeptide (TPR) repeat protein